ncbi:MAG: ABC transporter ATP-binding protein [Candidatus Dactylopiibacterium carminicum]|uniref:ABC transporter ATP-binding protein n=1 Tax=Candidatus Dactylopiibacterium carminicum TaxID=857335 RepID=A0A272EUJ9_9RHOO|nr:ATP-binding cassette domain-containing protein [Candidatus Dactylopiibacterium carminicum]KAF7599422.1 ABC transporter ATP-binding protein [Candidatus Dactylopiibacterium carminicum]PAS93420.1 MAG: ABC transporter ATP-binding protein [Candidatus Dactylopiibacterium carminicum]PAS95939.1 MAG: ABC transporter ATP-binding protein [Candidatus Dactylopiibacterium carminicum]PAS99430.1 MAG: ABC transporter ATP-binding protein [Candidatus Dactylopiibacterium carminicum]
MSPVVSLCDISTRLGGQWVHRGLTLDVAQGELMALVGGSGAGKTTLLRQITGLQRPTSGAIELFGEPLYAGRRSQRFARLRRLGMLFQQGALFSALTVFDNIAFPLREFGGLHEAEIRVLVLAKLGQVGLAAQHATLMPAQLSGGMVKRVALARALALEPELLLLDEPTAGLDPERSAAFVALIRQLHAELGFTVVFVTHDLDTLSALATRVAVLAERRILASGTLDEVHATEHPFIQKFFRYHTTIDETPAE